MKYSGHGKIVCEFTKLSKCILAMLLTSSDTKRTLMHLFVFTNSAQIDCFQYVRRVFATSINYPCIITLVEPFFTDFQEKKTLNKSVSGTIIPYVTLKWNSTRKPLSAFHTQSRLYNKVVYSRCAPMYGKCRLLS